MKNKKETKDEIKSHDESIDWVKLMNQFINHLEEEELKKAPKDKKKINDIVN